MSEDDDTSKPLSEHEKRALHQLKLGMEDTRRAHGALIEFHRQVGSSVNHFHNAMDHLYEAGHVELAEEIEQIVGLSVIDDYYSFEVYEKFETQFVDAVEEREQKVRDELADGERHIIDKQVKQKWYNRRY